MERQSNVELIRIVGMMFIVLGHVVLHATHDSLSGSEFIKAFTITGVNLFVLISGYWGIKLCIKSFLNIISTVIFYSLLSLLALVIFFQEPITHSEVKQLLFPMSLQGMYWFVSCYLMLMLISPAINVALEKASRMWYVGAVVVLCYISCVSGWWFHNPINPYGYNTFNMVFIYVLGYGIHRYNLHELLPAKVIAILYVVSTFVLILMFSFFAGRASNYNNPFVVISAVFLFCLILNMEFKSKLVNVVAMCMFPVYLIQEGFAGRHLYNLLYEYGVRTNFGLHNWGGYYTVLVIYVLGLLALALLIEPVRRKMMRPLIVLLSSYVTQKVNVISQLIK